MSYINLMWDALEGGLGQEKTAYLKKAKLNHVMREKVAHAHGVSLSSDMTLGDAVGALAISWRKKKANHRKITAGLASLGKVLPSSTEKTAESNVPRLYPVNASTHRKIAAATKLRLLASVAKGAESEKLAALRRQVDSDIVESLKKEANVLSAFAKHPAARNIGKGVGLGVGAGVPLYAAGSALSGKVSDDANAVTENARNRALETALGVGATAVGTYGLGKGIEHLSNRGVLPEGQKIASLYPAEENFKTAIYVDALLSEVPETEKTAEVREMNQEFAVDLLCDALSKTAYPQQNGRKTAWVSHEGFEPFDPLTYFDDKGQ